MVDQAEYNKEVTRLPVGLWSSEQAGNLGDRPQAEYQRAAIPPSVTAALVSPLVCRLLEESEGREGRSGGHGGDDVGNDIYKQLVLAGGCVGRCYSPHHQHTHFLIWCRDTSLGWAP